MVALLGLLSTAIGLASLVLWIMTLVKMFTDKVDGSVVKGIFGIICGIYAFIWGWQHHEKYNRKNFMLIWTALIVVGLLLNVMLQSMAQS